MISLLAVSMERAHQECISETGTRQREDSLQVPGPLSTVAQISTVESSGSTFLYLIKGLVDALLSSADIHPRQLSSLTQPQKLLNVGPR